MIKRGDRVRLTARAAAAFKKASTGRRGVVERITTNKANAVVLWDGRKSTEYVPIRSIEPEPAEKDDRLSWTATELSSNLGTSF